MTLRNCGGSLSKNTGLDKGRRETSDGTLTRFDLRCCLFQELCLLGAGRERDPEAQHTEIPAAWKNLSSKAKRARAMPPSPSGMTTVGRPHFSKHALCPGKELGASSSTGCFPCSPRFSSPETIILCFSPPVQQVAFTSSPCCFGARSIWMCPVESSIYLLATHTSLCERYV